MSLPGSRPSLPTGLLVGFVVLLVSGACAPDRSVVPPVPPPPSARPDVVPIADPDSVRIHYVCENRFRIRNFNDLEIGVQWTVVGTTDSGTVSLRPRQTGSPFSEVFLDVPDSGTVRLFVGSVRIASAQNHGGACGTRRLSVRLEPGVVVTSAPLDTAYPVGTPVAYSFAPAPGYTHVLVAVDDSLVPLSGSLVMSDEHFVWAAADVAVDLPAASDPLVAELHSLLTAADPVAAYQQMLDDLGALFDAVGPEDAARRVRLAGLAAFDPLRDSAALVRLDDALALHEFRLGSSQYDASGGTGGPVIIADRLPTGAARETVAGGGCMSQRPREVSGSPEPTRVVFVNGIRTAESEAAAAAARLRCALSRSGQTDGSEVTTGYFYNRTWSVQQLEDIGNDFWCTAATVRWVGYWSLMTQAAYYAACTGSATAIAVRTDDYVEAVTEFIQIQSNSPRIIEDADSLSRTLDHYRRDDGAHVIMVAHSQGNMLVQQAAKQLRTQGRLAPQRDSLCLGAVALAAPMRTNWSIDQDLLAGLRVPGDVIGALQGSDRFPSIPTMLSDSLSAEVAALREQATHMANRHDRRGLYALVAQQEVLNGLRLHSLAESYLGQQATRDALVNDIVHLHRQCTVGRLELSPTTATLRVQSSTPLALSALNRNSIDMKLNRIPAWTVPPNLELSGNRHRIIAKSPGSGEITARVFDREAGAGVDVPWEPLVVTARQEAHASWVLDLADAPADYPAPDPGPPPAWDGTPSHCTGSRTFTAVEPVYHATLRWLYLMHCWFSASGSVQPPEAIRIARYHWRWFDTSGLERVSPTNRLTSYSPQDMPADEELAPFAGWGRLEVWALDADGVPIAKGMVCISNCGGAP
jgi:hypothetical protein